MKILPPSTNHQYSGHLLSAQFLTLYSLLVIVPGAIHVFLPDGGAGVIAGLDLSHNRSTIIGLFAWAGATQMAWGGILLLSSLRFRSLVPLLLTLVLVERIIMALNMWVLNSPDGPHPPGAYGTLIFLPLLGFFLWLALRSRSG